MQNRSKISTDVNVKCKESQDITSPEIISIFYDVFSFGPIKWRSLMGSPFERFAESEEDSICKSN